MSDEFLQKYNGVLRGVMKWKKLDDLWTTVRRQEARGWYIYAPGHDLPEKLTDNNELDHFITDMDRLLHKEHDKDYCGIVYTDNFVKPTLIKIFDPNNLGTSCGSSKFPVQPGWVMSWDKPSPLSPDVSLSRNRKYWWSRLWG